MPYSGEGRRKILIVGEAPGEHEDKYGKQFVGTTGRFLERNLRRVGIDMRHDCWLTNALICHPKDNRTPTGNEIEYCRPNAINTIEELKPEIIILVGGPAVDSVIGWLWKDSPGAIGRWVGWHIPHQKLNAWICPIWHPSFVVRTESDKKKNPEVPVIWRHYLSEIAQLEGRPWKKVPNYREQIKVILDDKEASRQIRRFIEIGGYAAFDLETNCLKPDWEKARIVSCSICHNGEITISFPWRGEVIPAMEEFIRSDLWKIASNLKFEDRWMREEFGIGVRRWFWDTMNAAHIYDNRRETTSIKFQSFVWLGVEPYDDHIKQFLRAKDDSKFNQAVKEIGLKQLLLYGGYDSVFEYFTCFKQRKAMGYDTN